MIAPAELWVHQNNTTYATYGLTFKIIKVLAKMPLTRGLKNQNDSMVDFLHSDSD